MTFTQIPAGPPQTEHELMVRARALAGHTLGELALIRVGSVFLGECGEPRVRALVSAGFWG